MRFSTVSAVAALSSSFALAAQAQAQVTTQQVVTDPTAASSAAKPGNSEIVVTGEKTNRSLQETPASVAVTTNRTITDQTLLGVYDVLNRTPNVVANGSDTRFSIRGIDAFNVSGGGDGLLATVYLDGASIPQPALSVGPLDLYDIAQIEIFRGPQSTVQGRNALAGAVIIRTTDPSYSWTGRARALLTGPNGERRLAGAVGGPIIDGQLAFRVSGEVAASDGNSYNITRHEKADRRASETIRGKLLLTPDAIPGLRIVATYLHDRHQRGYYYTEFDPPYALRDRVAIEDVADVNTTRSDIATIEAGYDLARGISINSVTNYSAITNVMLFDTDRSPTPGGISRIDNPFRTFQQELRLNLDTSWVRGVIGGYYLREDVRGYRFIADQQLQLTRLGVPQALVAAGVPAVAVAATLNLYGNAVSIRNTLTQPRLTNNYAGYADLTFPITSRLRVVAGLRYDREDQDRGATQVISLRVPLPNPATSGALAPIVTLLNGRLTTLLTAANTSSPVRRVSYDAWLPKAGITFDAADNVSLSATAQRSYRAGGAGINQQRGSYYTYDPEYTWTYELALRSEFLDRRLTINANGFYTDWRNQQVTVRLTPGAVFDSQTINAGHSRVYGGELSITARPAPQLSLFAGAGYTNTKFLTFDIGTAGIQGAAAGNQVTLAPHWTLSGAATWQHPSGLFANVNAQYRSSFYQDTVIQTVPDIRPLTLVNARIGWQNAHFGAYLIASNIFDVAKPTLSMLDFDGRRRGVLTAPRTLGMSLEARF